MKESMFKGMRKLESADYSIVRKYKNRILKGKYKAIRGIGKKEKFDTIIYEFKCWKCHHIIRATWEQMKADIAIDHCDCDKKPKPTKMLTSGDVKCLGRIREGYNSLMTFEFLDRADGLRFKDDCEKTYKNQLWRILDVNGKVKIEFNWKHSELVTTYLNRAARHGRCCNGSNEWRFGAEYFEPSIFVDGKKDYDNPETEVGEIVQIQLKAGKAYPHRIYQYS